MSRYVVLGASHGLGAALVADLAATGAHIWAGARSVGVLRGGWGRSGSLVMPLYCDVTNPESVEHFWRLVGWAGGQIDGLIVTAGAQGEIGPVAQTDPAAWWATVATNLYGPYNALHYGLPHLTRTARIVLCAGGGAHTPWPCYSAYACAKAGVVRLAETLAQEIPQPVNALAPGFLPTGIHRATLDAGPGRAGEEHARTVARLDAIGPAAIDRAVACARWLLTEAPPTLTGRTLSAQHDPWDTDPAALLAPEAGTTTRIKPRAGVAI